MDLDSPPEKSLSTAAWQRRAAAHQLGRSSVYDWTWRHCCGIISLRPAWRHIFSVPMIIPKCHKEEFRFFFKNPPERDFSTCPHPQKQSPHFSAVHLNISGLKIPQTDTSIGIQIVAFPPRGSIWWWLSPLTCVINHRGSLRCRLWFSTRWLPWCLRPGSRDHSTSAVICLDVHWCRVPAQVQNNTAWWEQHVSGVSCT